MCKSKKMNLLFVAFVFDSGNLGSSSYGSVVFTSMLSGKELINNPCKMVVSLGDILMRQRFVDISPYIINDDFCTIELDKIPQFMDWPYCWVIEDICEKTAIQLDNRLKKTLTGYIGMTKIDTKSTDSRKQFWKMLIRDFTIKAKTITSFQDPELTGCFRHEGEASELGFTIKYDEAAEYSSIEKSKQKQSSFIKGNDDLLILNGENDSDRNLMEMNFAFCRELQIAGTLIWSSIEDINKIFFTATPLFNNDSYLLENSFLTLYHASQGIERLQKIIIELLCKINHPKVDEKEKIEKLLYSHNHQALNEWIKSKTGIEINEQNNRLLSTLERFYNNVRYSRYKDHSSVDYTSIDFYLINAFGNEHEKDINYDEAVKSTFGSSLGKLAYIYYEVICKLCENLNIYAYELEYESTASIVFLSDKKDTNLYKKFKKIRQGKKELLYWLIKNPERLPKYSLATMESLDFDPAMIDKYLEELINNKEAGQKLFDEVDSLYDELCVSNKKEWKDRIELIDFIIGEK